MCVAFFKPCTRDFAEQNLWGAHEQSDSGATKCAEQRGCKGHLAPAQEFCVRACAMLALRASKISGNSACRVRFSWFVLWRVPKNEQTKRFWRMQEIHIDKIFYLCYNINTTQKLNICISFTEVGILLLVKMPTSVVPFLYWVMFDFCVVANRGRAFFGVCDFGCTHFFI